MSPEPAHTALTKQSLAALQDCCEAELARYRRQPTGQESVCCREIVQRAASTADDDTFAALLAISRPTIQKRCPDDLRTLLDDLVQEVALRLTHKFTAAEQPFQVTTFAAYVKYLQLTCFSAAQEVRAQATGHTSLDALHAATGFEPAAPLPTDAVERDMLRDRLLALLPDPQMGEAFRRRFGLGQTPDEIAQALGLTRNAVYRLVEQAIRRLSNEPEVREMLEA